MLNETTPERSDQMCERADEGPETFASACQFAPNKVWTNPELRKTAFELLDVVQSALEAINVEHCIFYGTLLGTVRQGGPVSLTTSFSSLFCLFSCLPCLPLCSTFFKLTGSCSRLRMTDSLGRQTRFDCEQRRLDT